MKFKKGIALFVLTAAAALGAVFALNAKVSNNPTESIIGYVRDSECVYRFHEIVKPLPNGCVEACVRGGSSLVILTKQEEVYHPISPEMPAKDIRSKLLPFVGKLVKMSGTIYSRGGAKAIAVERIEELKE